MVGSCRRLQTPAVKDQAGSNPARWTNLEMDMDYLPYINIMNSVLISFGLTYMLFQAGRLCVGFNREWLNKHKWDKEKWDANWNARKSAEEAMRAQRKAEEQLRRAEHYKRRCTYLRTEIHRLKRLDQ